MLTEKKFFNFFFLKQDDHERDNIIHEITRENH